MISGIGIEIPPRLVSDIEAHAKKEDYEFLFIMAKKMAKEIAPHIKGDKTLLIKLTVEEK